MGRGRKFESCRAHFALHGFRKQWQRSESAALWAQAEVASSNLAGRTSPRTVANGCRLE